MKLKSIQNQGTVGAGGAVNAGQFKLDAPVETAKGAGPSTIGAAIAFICSLVSIILLGATAWMIYQNLDFMQNV